MLSGILIAIGFGSRLSGLGETWSPSLSYIAFLIAAILGLLTILGSVILAIRDRKVTINILMTIAVVGAILLGEVAEGAVVIFLNGIGELLEDLSLDKTRSSIRGLMALTPPTARVQTPSGEKNVALSEVEIGTTISVRSGERVPLDGNLLEGSAAVDESPITGESLPVDKQTGDQIYAGSLIVGSPVLLVTTAAEIDSMISRIIHMVEEAQSAKAPHEATIDRFAAVYTPIVVVLALLVAFVPPLIGLITSLEVGSLSTWVYRALTILVISCPCALVIATPITFISAISRAAKNGMLIKGGAFLELGSKLKAVAFDKTGTLTKGTPQVDSVVSFQETEDKVLALAAAIEQGSTHPLAQAIDAAAQARSLTLPEVVDLKEKAGVGVGGQIIDSTGSSQQVYATKPEYLENLHVDLTSEQQKELTALSESGSTVVALVVEKVVWGFIALSDTVRPDAQQAVGRLHEQGIVTAMLTGDHAGAAQAIGNTVGIDEIKSRLLPNDKVTAVEQLKARYGTVAMAGDGINDAPALAVADIGITMGGAGSDTALEVSDIALMSDDISLVPQFTHLSKRAMNVVRQNIALAIGVKALVMILAVMGVATMWMAIFADTGMLVIVALNGMRFLLPTKKEKRTGDY